MRMVEQKNWTLVRIGIAGYLFFSGKPVGGGAEKDDHQHPLAWA